MANSNFGKTLKEQVKQHRQFLRHRKTAAKTGIAYPQTRKSSTILKAEEAGRPGSPKATLAAKEQAKRAKKS